MNPRFLIISALAVSLFATSVPQFARASSAQIDQMTEDQREELLLGEIYKRMDGGMNSGGGNSLKGKMIESYRVDYRKLKGYNEVVSPILKQLGEKIPGLEKDLSKISNAKTWFLVPAEFSTIPRALSGIPANTEQTALNKKDIVWISQNNFDAKNTEQAGILVLHEMVMNYLMDRSRYTSQNYSTLELISKTQVMTSALLDINETDDVELKVSMPIGISHLSRQETVMIQEIKRLVQKAKQDQAEVCKKYEVLIKVEALKNSWRVKDSPQFYPAIRALLKVELQIGYPLFPKVLHTSDYISYKNAAKHNRFYKADLDQEISREFTNEQLSDVANRVMGLADLNEIPSTFSKICQNYECTGLSFDTFTALRKVCSRQPTTDYGW